MMNRLSIPIQFTLAAILSYWLVGFVAAMLVHEPHQMAGLWAIISALFVIRVSEEETVEAFWIRIVGSAVGCAMSLVPFWLLGERLNSFSILVSVGLASIVCLMAGLEKQMRLACVTLALILFLRDLAPEQPTWYFALSRFVYSVLGSFVGVGVYKASGIFKRLVPLS